MKKLLIAIAAIATATAVHAAAYQWSGTLNAYDWNNDIAGQGNVVFTIGGTTFGAIAFDANGDAAFGEYSVNAGDTIKVVATLTNFSDGSGVVEYSTVFSQAFIDSYASPDDALLNVRQSIDGAVNAGVGGGGLDFTASAAANGFSPASVPEPTSGLMLLLGMAGLALKRKRA